MEPTVDSREYRVVFFCPTSSAQLEHIEAPVRRVLTRIAAPPAELAPLETAGTLGEAGWRVYLVRSMTERSAAHALSAHITEVASAIASELDTEVLGLYVDVGSDSARISRCLPDESPETFAGRRQVVMDRTAEWLDINPVNLSALFQLGVEDADDEPDAEDRFVEAKLREARELMQRYRQGK
jgi:NAD(P)-dependent dehydrogenase (short-subunit alcohol dehydrogenase family)